MWYIYTTGYYSAVEKNKVMRFAVKRVELGKILPSEVCQVSSPQKTKHVFSQMHVLASNLLSCVFSPSTCGSQETRNRPPRDGFREDDSRIQVMKEGGNNRDRKIPVASE